MEVGGEWLYAEENVIRTHGYFVDSGFAVYGKFFAFNNYARIHGRSETDGQVGRAHKCLIQSSYEPYIE